MVIIHDQRLFHEVMLAVMPPHACNQLQSLELGFVALHKLGSRRVHRSSRLNAQTVKLLKVLSDFQKEPTPFRALMRFQWAGLCPDRIGLPRL
jgi:hypothetical protein